MKLILLDQAKEDLVSISLYIAKKSESRYIRSQFCKKPFREM